MRTVFFHPRFAQPWQQTLFFVSKRFRPFFPHGAFVSTEFTDARWILSGRIIAFRLSGDEAKLEKGRKERECFTF